MWNHGVEKNIHIHIYICIYMYIYIYIHVLHTYIYLSMGVFEMSGFFLNGLENPLKNHFEAPLFPQMSHVNFRSLAGGDMWNWVDHFDRTVLSFEFTILDYWIIYWIHHRQLYLYWIWIIYWIIIKIILKLYTGLLD